MRAWRSSGDWRVVAGGAGSLGAGDVTIESGVSLRVDVADVMDDTATLYLNGNNDTKSGITKLVMNANDTIAAFVIDGVDQCFGDFDSSTHPGIISGSGTLTVTASATTPAQATATVVHTFKDGAYENAPFPMVTVTSTSDIDEGHVVVTTTTTAATWTFSVLPVAAKVYTFHYQYIA